MPDAEIRRAIDHAIGVLSQSQQLLLMVSQDKPEDLGGVGRKAVLGKHVREIENTVRELRKLLDA